MVVVTITLRPRSHHGGNSRNNTDRVGKGRAFVPFEITRSRTQNVPEEYLKNAHWGIVDGDESYHARSLVEGDEHFYPVEFVLT